MFSVFAWQGTIRLLACEYNILYFQNHAVVVIHNTAKVSDSYLLNGFDKNTKKILIILQFNVISSQINLRR